jgi:hypothetical protein
LASSGATVKRIKNGRNNAAMCFTGVFFLGINSAKYIRYERLHWELFKTVIHLSGTEAKS